MTDISKISIERINDLVDKLNEINTKFDTINSKLNSMKYVVEYWQEGTEWYRIWSDGWIEQGGFVGLPAAAGSAINFKKSFQTSNYSFIVTGTGNSDGRTSVLNRRGAMGWIFDNTTAYVCATAGTDRSETVVRWYACGY